MRRPKGAEDGPDYGHLEIEMARLAERVEGLRSIIAVRVDGLDRLVDEKFVKFRTLIDSEADKVSLALQASKEAISKAETATEKRFDSVNEFREQLRDQANTFMPRREAEQRIASVSDRFEAGREVVTLGDQKLDERIKALERGSANLQGRFAAVGAVVAVVVVIVNVAIALLTK